MPLLNRPWNSSHDNFYWLDAECRVLKCRPVFWGGASQAFKRLLAEVRTDLQVAHYRSLDLVVKVLKCVRLGHEIVLKAASTPALLTLSQEKVQDLTRFAHMGSLSFPAVLWRKATSAVPT